MSFFKSWKVKVSMIGGAIVIATTYGTCTIDPDEEAVKEVVEEKVLKSEEKTGEPEKSDTPEKSEEANKETEEKPAEPTPEKE